MNFSAVGSPEKILWPPTRKIHY